MSRIAILAVSGLGGVLLCAPAMADQASTSPDDAGAKASVEFKYTEASRYDTTTLRADELAKLLPASRHSEPSFEVPNQFPTLEQREINDLEADPLVARGAVRNRRATAAAELPRLLQRRQRAGRRRSPPAAGHER